MREMTFSKEPKLTGPMKIEKRFALYFISNEEGSFPQKLAECEEGALNEVMDELLSRLEKNGLTYEKTNAGDEYFVSGEVTQTANNGATIVHSIEGTIYPGSFMTIINSIQRKAMERAFGIYRKPQNNRQNNRGGNKNGYKNNHR